MSHYEREVQRVTAIARLAWHRNVVYQVTASGNIRTWDEMPARDQAKWLAFTRAVLEAFDARAAYGEPENEDT